MLIRIVTGLFLLIVATTILVQGGDILFYSAFVLFLTINFEYCQMIPNLLRSERCVLFFINLLILPLMISKGMAGLGTSFLICTILVALLSCIWVDRSKGIRQIPVDSLYLGLCYIGGLGSFMAYFASLPGANVVITWILSIVVFSDSFAYFGGKFFGKTKLCETISPNKTVFGMISGFCGAIIAAIIAAYYLNMEFSVLQIVINGFVVATLAQFGDLFESLLKRRVGVKDSGSILPGHGGFLDRIDALLFALPIGYLLLTAK